MNFKTLAEIKFLFPKEKGFYFLNLLTALYYIVKKKVLLNCVEHIRFVLSKCYENPINSI